MKILVLVLGLALGAVSGCATPADVSRDDLYSLKGDGSTGSFSIEPEAALSLAGDIFRNAGLYGVERAQEDRMVSAYGHKGGAFGTYAAAWADPIPGGSMVTVVTRGKVNMGLWSSIKLLDEGTFLDEFGKRAQPLGVR